LRSAPFRRGKTLNQADQVIEPLITDVITLAKCQRPRPVPLLPFSAIEISCPVAGSRSELDRHLLGSFSRIANKDLCDICVGLSSGVLQRGVGHAISGQFGSYISTFCPKEDATTVNFGQMNLRMMILERQCAVCLNSDLDIYNLIK